MRYRLDGRGNISLPDESEDTATGPQQLVPGTSYILKCRHVEFPLQISSCRCHSVTFPVACSASLLTTRMGRRLATREEQAVLNRAQKKYIIIKAGFAIFDNLRPVFQGGVGIRIPDQRLVGRSGREAGKKKMDLT